MRIKELYSLVDVICRWGAVAPEHSLQQSERLLKQVTAALHNPQSTALIAVCIAAPVLQYPADAGVGLQQHKCNLHLQQRKVSNPCRGGHGRTNR